MKTLDVWTRDKFAPAMQLEIASHGLDVQWELKMVTANARYWICTNGAEPGSPGVPRWFVRGNAIREPTRGGEVYLDAYSPELADLLQDLDSVRQLISKVDELSKKFDREGGDENWRVLEAAREALTEELKNYIDRRDERFKPGSDTDAEGS